MPQTPSTPPQAALTAEEIAAVVALLRDTAAHLDFIAEEPSSIAAAMIACCDALVGKDAALAAQAAAIETLREALEWYGSAAVWASSPGRTVHLDGAITAWTSRPIDTDGGRRASAALTAGDNSSG